MKLLQLLGLQVPPALTVLSYLPVADEAVVEAAEAARAKKVAECKALLGDRYMLARSTPVAEMRLNHGNRD